MSEGGLRTREDATGGGNGLASPRVSRAKLGATVGLGPKRAERHWLGMAEDANLKRLPPQEEQECLQEAAGGTPLRPGVCNRGGRVGEEGGREAGSGDCLSG